MTEPMTSPPAQAASLLVQNYRRQDVRFVRGEGCHLVDDNGRRYLDAFAGVAVSALGHAHPRLVAAIADQAGRLIHASNHYGIPEQEAVARLVVPNAFPGRMLFCNSGTEAVEIAYKAARLWGNVVHQGAKTRMIAFINGFHGRTLGALSITANAAYREPFHPLAPAEFLPYNDVSALRAAMRDDVAAVFVEPIQGEGGLFTATTEFLAAARALCSAHQALLVVDEIQTGIGRTGRAFAFQHHGIVPDAITLAKALGGGVPIGAALLSDPVAALITPGLHGTTFGGNPLACAAARVVLETVFTPSFLAGVQARGEELAAELGRRLPALPMRGKGLLVGLALGKDPALVVKACLAEGLVVGPCGNQTLRIAPPLIITREQVVELVDRLVRGLAKAG
jgi:acetylornithine/N-succinyldiaminopimelate aminotransferase